ncbi:MAG: hypothetical protein AAGH53_03605 [Pseudomonadota bacterium]
MMPNKTLTGTLMLTAALAMAAPVQAAPIGSGPKTYNLEQLRQTSLLDVDDIQWDQADETANRWGRRRWRRCGWGRCRRGIRGGDILAGALIIGGIAAIASAASRNSRDRDVREYPRNPPVIVQQPPVPVPQQADPRFNNRAGVSDLSSAADQCSAAVQAQAGDGQIDRITSVARDGEGWRVEGRIGYPQGQEPFLCGVTSGQIDYIQIGVGDNEEF